MLVLLLLASCTAAPTQVPVSSTQTPSPAPTIKPTKTEIPTATPIPGFEDWSVLIPGAVDIKSNNGSLFLTLKGSVLWFMDRRGELIYKSVHGNFKITADVHTAKTSEPDQPPGGDGSVQLGGLMARSGKGGQENYLFIVVGDDGDGLSVETKNTTNSFSKYQGTAWESADAQLRICRVGQKFNLYKRSVDSTEAWQLADSFDRPDLPEELQVGVNIYTDGTPDLQVRYDRIMIASITSEVDCETD